MVSQVDLNTAVGTAVQPQQLPALPGNNAAANKNGSLFTNYNSVPTNDYSNDIYMSNMNFGQFTAPAASQTQPQPQSFQGGNQAIADQQSEPKKSNIFKVLLAAGGLATPFVLKAKEYIEGGKLKGIFKDGKIIELLKSGKVTKFFKNKEFLVSCPIFAVVGLGLGMMLDSCFSSRKAAKDDQKVQMTDQQQREIIRNFVNQ
ncbi:hypothetical protein IKR55_04185 [bacterium]|nr:hypothetical protein [bacterium]